MYDPNLLLAWARQRLAVRPTAKPTVLDVETCPQCGDARGWRHRLYTDPASPQGIRCFRHWCWTPAERLVGDDLVYSPPDNLDELRGKIGRVGLPNAADPTRRGDPARFARWLAAGRWCSDLRSPTVEGLRLGPYARRRVPERYLESGGVGYFADPRHKFSGRLVLLVRDELGAPVFCCGRHPVATPKYLYPKEGDVGCTNSDVLWGAEKLEPGSTVALCEGILSAMSCEEHTGWAAVACLGPALRPPQADILFRRGVHHVVLFLEEGQTMADAKRQAQLLYDRGISCDVAPLCGGDPNNGQKFTDNAMSNRFNPMDDRQVVRHLLTKRVG